MLALTLSAVLSENFGDTWAVKGGDSAHRDDELTATEKAFQKMNGRCCFDGEWVGEIGHKQWVQHAMTCGSCSMWGELDSSCHLSARSCAECGVPLYCDRPPPLVATQHECVGSSRVGVGCQDPISMGLCMDQGIEDCHEVRLLPVLNCSHSLHHLASELMAINESLTRDTLTPIRAGRRLEA